VLKDAWGAAMIAQIEAAADAASTEFKKNLEKLRAGLPMDLAELNVALRALLDEAFGVLDSAEAPQGSGKAVSELQDKLREEWKGLAEQMFETNATLSNENCCDLFETLWNAPPPVADDSADADGAEDSKDGAVEKGEVPEIVRAMNGVWDQFERLQDPYFKLGKGPSAIPVFQDGIRRCLRPAMGRIVGQATLDQEDLVGRLAQEEQHRSGLMEELAAASQQLGVSQAQIADLEGRVVEQDKMLEAAAASVTAKTDELLQQALVLDTRTAELSAEAEKATLLQKQKEEAELEASNLDGKCQGLRKELQALRDDILALRRRSEAVAAGIASTGGDIKKIKGAQESLRAWAKEELQIGVSEHTQHVREQLEAVLEAFLQRATRQQKVSTERCVALKAEVEELKQQLSKAEAGRLDFELVAKRTEVLRGDEEAQSQTLKTQVFDAMARAEKAEAKLKRLEQRQKRAAKKGAATFGGYAGEEKVERDDAIAAPAFRDVDAPPSKADSSEGREEAGTKQAESGVGGSASATASASEDALRRAKKRLRNLQQQLEVSNAINSLQRGMSVTKYHAGSNKKDVRFIAYNASSEALGWCKLNPSKRTQPPDKVPLKTIASVSYGRPEGTFLSRAKSEQPWRCFTVKTKGAKGRSYDFVAGKAADAIDAVLALQRLAQLSSQNKGHFLWDKVRLRMDCICHKLKKSREELIASALSKGGPSVF